MMPVAALLMVWSTGVLSRQLFRPGFDIRPAALIHDLPLSFGLGGGLIFTLFLLCSWAGPFNLLWLLILPGVILPALFVKRRREADFPRTPPTPSEAWRPADTIALSFLLLALAAFTALVFGSPLLDWDTRIIWALKAKILAVEKTVVSDAFRNPYRLHIHPRYPLMVPWLTAFISQFDGAYDESHYKLLLTAYSLLSVQLLFQMARRQGDRGTALLLCLIMIFTGSWMSGILNSGVEIVVAFYLLLALQAISRWNDSRHLSELVMAGFFLFCCASTKNEGLLLALALCAAVPFASPAAGSNRFRLAEKAMPALIFASFAALWFRHLSYIPPVSDENYFSRIHFTYLAEGLDRLGTVVKTLAGAAADMKQWHLTWLLPPVIFLGALKKQLFREPTFLLPFLLLLLYLPGIFGIYLLSPWRDIQMHISVTFHRVMLPMLPVILLLFHQVIVGRVDRP